MRIIDNQERRLRSKLLKAGLRDFAGSGQEANCHVFAGALVFFDGLFQNAGFSRSARSHKEYSSDVVVGERASQGGQRFRSTDKAPDVIEDAAFVFERCEEIFRRLPRARLCFPEERKTLPFKKDVD